MLIYKATNIQNGKIYIGQTTKTLEERKKTHKRDSERLDTYFYRAIRKYGWDSFKWEILQDNISSKEELDILEQYYIKLYNCFDNPAVGYNTQSGGHSFKVTQEECKKRSERMMGEKNPMYGKPGTWLNKKFSEEHKKHISEALQEKPRPATSGEKNPSAKKVINLTTGEVFNYMELACKKYNISHNSLTNHLMGKTKTCCGCHWSYYEENKNYTDLINEEKQITSLRNPKKKVYILELDKIFPTATAAAKAINCDNSSISKACKKVANDDFAIVKNYHVKYCE